MSTQIDRDVYMADLRKRLALETLIDRLVREAVVELAHSSFSISEFCKERLADLLTGKISKKAAGQIIETLGDAVDEFAYGEIETEAEEVVRLVIDKVLAEVRL